MTLDIKKWLSVNIETQQKIAHNETAFTVADASKLPEHIRTKVMETFGESFLLDAQYIIWFKQYDVDFAEKDIKKLFKIVDAALGKSANNMNQGEFKRFSIISQTDDAEADAEIVKTKPYYLFIKITIK